MSFLEETNADAIMEKYNQASELGQNIPPIDSLTNKKIAYNISTGKNDVLLPMDGGGYVVLAELDKDKTQEIKEYAHILKDMPFDIKNYEAAGYTLEEVEAAGIMPKPVEKTGRTEPLTRGEELLVTRSGGDLAMPREQTLREKDVQWMTENGEGELRQIYEVLGMDYNEALDLARRIFGNVNSTRGDLGLGIADFTTMGIFYGSEEGINTYLRGRNSGDNVTAAFGALEAGLSLIEAFPVTAAGAKGLKKNIPLLREGLEEFGQALKQRLNQPGKMPTVGSMGGNVFAPGDPKLITDPILRASGEATPPKAENITLGEASETPMVSQLAPEYRVTLNGVQPGGTGKQSFIPKAMTPSNFSRASTNLDTISQDFTDPLSSPENYALMMGSVQNSIEVPAPPKWMIEHANDMDKWSDWFGGLTDTQIKAADEGLAVQNQFKQAYTAGASPNLTGQLMLWSILSRRLSAFPHESGYLDLAQAAKPYVEKAARGEWSDADTANWLKMVKTTIPAGTPGKSATSNANDFGKVFLRKMAAVDEQGVSALTRLHEMIADPNMSSAQIRRAYYGLAEDTGIANKILSFALLVSGRNDVVVLDRIQINRMWAGGDKIYDNVYKQFEGAQGLAQYEALERSLQNRVQTLYEKVGRGDKGSVGRYHWESWVLSSGQVVSHPTLETVVKTGAPDPKRNIPPTASTPVMEGRFNKWYSGVQYEQLPDGSNRYIYKTSDGTPFQFTKKSLDDMLDIVKKKSSGVLPGDFPGVTSFEGGNIPWYEYDGVDRGKIDKFIREAGKPIS